MKEHRYGPRAGFEKALVVRERIIQTTRGRLADGTGVPQICYRTLMNMQIQMGCCALILGRTDPEVVGSFTSAARDAFELLSAQGVPGGGARVYDAELKATPEGVLADVQERQPQRGSEKLSINDFHRALLLIVTFGDRQYFARCAEMPEDRYSSPGTVASLHHWQFLRAWKALLAGREDEAKRQAAGAYQKAPGPAYASLLALLEGNADALRSAVAEDLKEHEAAFENQPNEPLSAVSFPSLAVCRMALDRGIEMEDQSYLPVRLLPNYAASRT